MKVVRVLGVLQHRLALLLMLESTFLIVSFLLRPLLYLISGRNSVVTLTALLSVNLGIINLLPIPALDGGKLLLNIIEAIRRKPLDPDKPMVSRHRLRLLLV